MTVRRRLGLHRETLRQLGAEWLPGVGGGITGTTCAPFCTPTPPQPRTLPLDGCLSLQESCPTRYPCTC